MLCVRAALCYHTRVTMQARSLFWGSLSAQWVAKALVALLSIGLTVLLGRRLGPAVFGDFSFLMAAGGLWVLLQDGGYATLLFREGIKGSQDLAGHDLDLLHRHATGNVLAASLLGAVLAVTLLSDMRLCGVLMVAMFAGSALATFVSPGCAPRGPSKPRHCGPWPCAGQPP